MNIMLKTNTIFATIGLAFCLLLGGAFTAYGSQPANGFFDAFEGNTIVGWGWDSSTPNTAVPVHVTVTNKDSGEVVGDFKPTAGTFRQDLKENGIGNGNHGFRISMDWDSLPDGSYVIQGWIEGQEFENTKTYVKGETAPAEEAAPAAEEPQQNSGMRSLGLFRTTAYCPCYKCSEGWGRHTSSGATAHARHTIAVDPRVIPMGSKVMIGGVIYTAEDRGGGVKGNHIDIFYDTHAQTRQHGSFIQEVFLVQ